MLTRLIRKLVRDEPFYRGGLYKQFSGITWEEKKLPKLTYEELGFKGYKENQLKKNYINEDEVQRVEDILTRRSQGKGHHMTSVALNFRGEAKRRQSQGWCLLSMVVSRTKRPAAEIIEFQYRSTEAIFKFGADLVLMDWVLNRLNLNPDLIRWRFANIHLSGVYLPTLFNWWEPRDFLQFVHDNDMDFLKRGCRWLLRSSYTEDQFFPYSPEQVQHKINWNHSEYHPSEIVNFLEPLYVKYGYDLPKLHHQRETYRTRRKKSVEEE